MRRTFALGIGLLMAGDAAVAQCIDTGNVISCPGTDADVVIGDGRQLVLTGQILADATTTALMGGDRSQVSTSTKSQILAAVTDGVGVSLGRQSTLTNGGVIDSLGFGARLGELSRLSNTGELIGNVQGVGAGEDSILDNFASATISSDNVALGLGRSARLRNFGTITGGSLAIRSVIANQIENSGTISGGINVFSDSLIQNLGTIEATDGAIEILRRSTVVNQSSTRDGLVGKIHSDNGVALELGQESTLDNRGEIRAGNDSGSGKHAVSVFSGIVTNRETGTIVATASTGNAAGVFVNGTVQGTTLVRNDGLIEGQIGIQSTELLGITVVSNGTIRGRNGFAGLLGNGSDELSLSAISVVDGTFNFGLGNDRLVVRSTQAGQVGGNTAVFDGSRGDFDLVELNDVPLGGVISYQLIDPTSDLFRLRFRNMFNDLGVLLVQNFEFFSFKGDQVVAAADLDPIPVPAALPLFGGALAAFGFYRRRLGKD